MDSNFCQGCGMESPAPHRNAADCIAGLREKIAELEFRVEQLAARPPAERKLRAPKYHMPVVLDGKQQSLADAAERLGLRPKVLYERVYSRLSRNRTRKGVRVSGVDLRALKVDWPLLPWGVGREVLLGPKRTRQNAN